MIIKNRSELVTTVLRKKALDIAEAGITRILPSNMMPAAVQFDVESRALSVNNDTFDLSNGRLFVIGGGKAAGLMAETLEKIIGAANITAGVVNCKTADYKTSRIKINEAGHPIPDERGFNGVNEMLALKERYGINEKDIMLCLLSGGGSSLMPCPVPGVSLEDKRKMTEILLLCGADITEINAVRKHISRIKGGRLGEFFAPATVVSLIISDVIGNDLSAIASGPTYPDSSTFPDADYVLMKYTLTSQAPASIVSYLERSWNGGFSDTPKKLTNCRNYIIADSSIALAAMMNKAKEMGLRPVLVTAEQKGDTAFAATLHAAEIISGKYAGYDVILLGGETTPRLPDGHGLGGRNQHYAAASIMAMKSYPGQWALASVGTDGSDFLPNIAGAIVDDTTLHTAIAKRLNVRSFVDCFDSYTLLQNIGNSLIITGNTGTNVGDIIVYVMK
jgi:glycerate 2-kinase